MSAKLGLVHSAIASQTFAFVDDLRRVQTVAALNAAFRGLTGAWGFDSWNSVRLSLTPGVIDAPSTRGFGEPPALWVAHYTKKRYMFVDPVIRRVLRTDAPFYWSEALDDEPPEPAAITLFGEAAEFGLVDGVVVPVRIWDGALWIVTVAGEIVEKSPAILDAMGVAARAYLGRGLSLIPIARKNAEGARLLTAPLTPRERELVALVAAGLRSAEIAAQLNITPRTVEFLLADARRRYGARTTAELVASALRAGEID